MEKCPKCGEYTYTGLKFHKCKEKWFCFNADDFKKDVIPTAEEFASFGTSVTATDPQDAAIEYMKWTEERYSDNFDEMSVFVLEKHGLEERVYRYEVNAETTREYFTYGKPEIFELKIDDTKGNPKLFEF